jgi:chromate transport protein ChrA
VSAGAWEVGRVFLKLGAVSYGGPAMMGIMQAELERKRQWVTRERFVEGLALVNFLPGPLAVQLSIVLGYVRAGWLGGVLAGLGFIFPGFAIMLALTILYSAYGALPAVRGVLYGLSPVVIGIFAVAVYRLGRAAIKDRAQIVIAVASAVLLGLTPLGIVPTILLAAAAGVTVYASRGWGLATAVVVLGLAIARLWMGPSAAPLLAGTAPLLAGGGEDASALASPDGGADGGAGGRAAAGDGDRRGRWRDRLAGARALTRAPPARYSMMSIISCGSLGRVSDRPSAIQVAQRAARRRAVTVIVARSRRRLSRPSAPPVAIAPGDPRSNQPIHSGSPASTSRRSAGRPTRTRSRTGRGSPRRTTPCGRSCACRGR